MINHAVHWSEGLFISPHHFQLSERRLREELALSQQWHVGYSYGIHKIETDLVALTNWQVSISTLHVQLRDQTFLRFPEDALLPPVEIPRAAFRGSQDRLMVHVAIPRLQLGRKNAEQQASTGTVRYLVESQKDVEDENQVGNSLDLDVRWLNAKLLLGDDELAGYETLPIMRLRLSSVADAPPEIDTDYIPSVLACDAWPYLQRLLSDLYNKMGREADRLASDILGRGLALESNRREELEKIFRLHALNACLGCLVHLKFARGIHPLFAYIELCRFVGQKAVFLPQRRMPEVPNYDHDDLGRCFHAVLKWLISDEPKQRHVCRPFKGSGQIMRVLLDREWFTDDWTFFVAVESKLAFNEIELLLTTLDLKIGSSNEVEGIFRGGKGGVAIHPETSPPDAFPKQDLTYWSLDRRSIAWQAVGVDLDLGIRFNTNQVIGGIEGKQSIQVRTAQAKFVTLAFFLYAMPSNSQPAT